MKRPSPLPEQLQYLEPVRKQLAGLASEEINEDTDLSVLRKCIRKKRKDVPADELEKVLIRDADLLEKWISESKGRL